MHAAYAAEPSLAPRLHGEPDRTVQCRVLMAPCQRVNRCKAEPRRILLKGPHMNKHAPFERCAFETVAHCVLLS